MLLSKHASNLLSWVRVCFSQDEVLYVAITTTKNLTTKTYLLLCYMSNMAGVGRGSAHCNSQGLGLLEQPQSQMLLVFLLEGKTDLGVSHIGN